MRGRVLIRFQDMMKDVRADLCCRNTERAFERMEHDFVLATPAHLLRFQMTRNSTSAFGLERRRTELRSPDELAALDARLLAPGFRRPDRVAFMFLPVARGDRTPAQ